MKYLAATASGLLAALSAFILLNIASAMCAVGGAFPMWARYTIFAVLCVIALGAGAMVFQATLHRLGDKRNYPGGGQGPGGL